MTTNHQIKKTSIIAFICFLSISNNDFGQSNALPSVGNVGIGTTNPSTKLQVNGSARIDSTLTVKDSIIVLKDAHVKQKLTVDNKVVMKNDAVVQQNFKVVGETNLIGNTVIKEGTFKIKPLIDTALLTDGVLLIDGNGKVKNGGDLKSLMYTEHVSILPCKDDAGGNLIPTTPVWLNGTGKLYTSNTCVPDVKVGIGQNNPESKLHITANHTKSTLPLLVDKSIPGSSNRYKLLELDNTGLLYAREVKVNLDAWPDYVFDTEYKLMTLSDLKSYIAKNNHLPNVPNACEMEEKGVNIAETSTMLMEKIEELTLYMIDLQEQLKEQQLLLRQQQELIQNLQENQKN